MVILLSGIYIAIGFAVFFWLGAYGVLSPPSRLVKVESGGYMYKDYLKMPHWVWCTILTIIWLPYLIWFLIALSKHDIL